MKFYSILFRTLAIEFVLALGLSLLFKNNFILNYLIIELLLQKFACTENARREEIALQQYQNIVESMTKMKAQQK